MEVTDWKPIDSEIAVAELFWLRVECTVYRKFQSFIRGRRLIENTEYLVETASQMTGFKS